MGDPTEQVALEPLTDVHIRNFLIKREHHLLQLCPSASFPILLFPYILARGILSLIPIEVTPISNNIQLFQQTMYVYNIHMLKEINWLIPCTLIFLSTCNQFWIVGVWDFFCYTSLYYSSIWRWNIIRQEIGEEAVLIFQKRMQINRIKIAAKCLCIGMILYMSDNEKS